MNAWLIGYVVCCIIALALYIFEVRKRGYFSVYMIIELLFALALSPLFIFHYSLENTNLGYVIWERKK